MYIVQYQVWIHEGVAMSAGCTPPRGVAMEAVYTPPRGTAMEAVCTPPHEFRTTSYIRAIPP